MEPRKAAIMQALDKFVAQRPGLEFGNYFGVRDYRSEMRGITRDRHDYNTLARAVERSDSITADMLIKASESAFSGRLTIKDDSYTSSESRKFIAAASVSYVTGQYFPTEYRKAAAAVLAAALWAHTRENCMPQPCNHDQYGSPLYSDPRGKAVVTTGDWLCAYFRREFGRSVASRWFS